MNKFTSGRIAKFIAAAGVCSRRQAEEMILQGRVRIDGKTINTPVISVTPENVVEVDGKVISEAEQTRLWLYYKPVGLITTHPKLVRNRPKFYNFVENRTTNPLKQAVLI